MENNNELQVSIVSSKKKLQVSGLILLKTCTGSPVVRIPKRVQMLLVLFQDFLLTLDVLIQE